MKATPFALLAMVLTAGSSVAQADVVADLLELTGGKRVKLIWAANEGKRLDVLDTQEGSVRTLVGGDLMRARPSITPDGERVLYSNGNQMKVYLINWDGSGQRQITSGYGADIYHKNGKDYALIAEGTIGWPNGPHPVYRVDVDNPSDRVLLWDKSDLAAAWMEISPDGNRLGGSFPWSDCGEATVPNGTFFHFGNGCWPSITPDNTYRVCIFDGAHKNWHCYNASGQSISTLALNVALGGDDLYHPRFTNHPGFMTMTGPTASQGPVYFQQINEGLTQITGWVRVQGGNNRYTDAWVDPADQQVVRIDSFSADPETILQGESTSLSWSTSFADQVSIDAGIGQVGTSGSRSITPPGTTTYTLSAQGPGGPATSQVTVTVIALRDPDDPADILPGINAAYYELDEPDHLPDFSGLEPCLSGVVDQLNYPSTSGVFAGSGRQDNLGAVFSGYVYVSEDGLYTFSVESDDGSALYVGYSLVVDNDGAHGMTEQSGSIGLRAGKHAIQVAYFENAGGAGLIVRGAGPGLSSGVIPPSAWYRDMLQPQMILSAAELTFAAEIGGPDPADQTVGISNAGDGILDNVSTDVTYTLGTGNWLRIEASGSGNNQALANAIDSAQLVRGRYTAVVTVTSAGSSSSPATYTVVLEISEQSPVLTGIEVSPDSPGIDPGADMTFTARALDQFGGPFAAAISWSASGGGRMDPDTSGAPVSEHQSTFRSDGTTGLFTVTASSGTVEGTTTISVTPTDTQAPQVHILAPGEDERVSGTVQVLGTTSDNVGISVVEVQVDQDAFQPAVGTVEFSFDVDTLVLNNGAHTIRVRASDIARNSASESVEIFVDNQASITIEQPAGSEQWVVGSTRNIRWQTVSLGTARIYVSIDGGKTWELIPGAESLTDKDPEFGDFPWKIPDRPSASCRIRIQGYVGEAPTESNEFSIVPGGTDPDDISIVGDVGCQTTGRVDLLAVLFVVLGCIRRCAIMKMP